MVGDVVITFETIFDTVRREKELFELQKLDKSFFSDTSFYLAEKLRMLEAGDDVVREHLIIQVANIKKLIHELYFRREKKIVDIAINKSRTNAVIDTSNMLPDERRLYEGLVGILSTFRTSFVDGMLNARAVQKQGVLVKFLAHVDSFIGKELEEYGPFEQNQLVRLPQEIASLLVSNGKAIETGE
ncbi:DNA replication complex GINS family protein [Candidatus Woesearchaeota archaeon]|nr:DNA replication complex GINS family protein [Candidatus Woesearchaeota archaeon]